MHFITEGGKRDKSLALPFLLPEVNTPRPNIETNLIGHREQMLVIMNMQYMHMHM